MLGKEFLDKLDERLQDRLPEVYEKNRSPMDDTPSRKGGAKGGKKSYDNLPPEAKAACDKFIKSGLFKSKQDYVDMYDWS